MEIIQRRAPAPTIEPHIEEALLEMEPKVFLVWNSVHRSFEKFGTKRWEGRWEIWCELRHSTHPDATNELHETDRWNSDHQCYMRKLQTYQTADGEFAPADERLLVGLRMADAWADRRFYEENIERPFEQQEAAREAARREIYAGGAEYYRTIDSTRVGGHVSSGWRWRIR